ncbi:MAG TPA: carbonic anhydrase [Acidimicrobiales bacterium]|jgi:carbonic anhydrase|nr:carbonic anhydrase [Acidimicrobiales bacterium]
MYNPSRRAFLAKGAVATGGILAGAALAGCSSGTSVAASTTTTFPQVKNGDDGLARLVAGNDRFVSGNPTHQGRTSARQVELVDTQSPYAIILGCSDSRVSPEIIFDEGIGELFVVRVAGNTAMDPILLGSIEYSVEALGSVLLMVLGHENCGAVKAALSEVQKGTKFPGDIGNLLGPVVPAAQSVGTLPAGSQLDAAIKQNVLNMVQLLNSSAAILQPAVAAGTLKIVGAEYTLRTGKVTILT